MRKYFIFLLLFAILVACDATKRVPEGSYLLDEIKIETDTKHLKESDLKPFLRQTPNSSAFVFGKMGLHIYNMTPDNSTWLSRQLHKWGEPPVLFSERLTGLSIEQLHLELKNRGYLNAKVDTAVVKTDKKAKITYHIEGHDPYVIHNYRDSIASDTTIHKIIKEQKHLATLSEGDVFDLKELDKVRTDITRTLRNNGYYRFPKDNLYFLADTTVGNHQVDLTLGLNNPTDSTRYQPYYFGEVTVFNEMGDSESRGMQRQGSHSLDTTYYKGFRLISDKGEKFLSSSAIFYNTFIRQGRLYSDKSVERTYASLNKLGSVSQTNINLTAYQRNDSNFIDTQISLTPGALHYMQFGVDGTNSAGDLGVAANITYEHRNLFHGAERLRVSLNGAYELISNTDNTGLLDKNYYEYGTEVSLSLPQLMFPWLLKRLKDQPLASTEFAIGANFQKRPEYLRQFLNLSSRFTWSSSAFRFMHMVEPISINYVLMPWKSERFEQEYLNETSNPILRYSYNNQFIVSSSYRLTYSNTTAEIVPRYPFRIRAGVEVAGHIPHLVTALGGSVRNGSGFYEIWNTPYAEYVKGDLDVAPTFPITADDMIATHLAVGVAYPYGNSIVLPFEKRYFGGGANSIRGWSTRTLGPGSYIPESGGYDFGRQVGDIKLDMSVEYRRKLTSIFELATFIDAGNIWTIKKYEQQPNGNFQLSRFYKEIAMAYGIGLRVNLSFLLIRSDFGMKAYNPALPESQRWTLFKPHFKRDFAWHFAIGYPF